MDNDVYVPVGKLDMAAIDRAERAGYPAINDVLPNLLEWVQDANWPVAMPTAKLLGKAGTEIVSPIRQALQSDDGIWKYWIITLILSDLPDEVFNLLRQDCARLAQNPSADDRVEEVDIEAAAILAARPVS